MRALMLVLSVALSSVEVGADDSTTVHAPFWYADAATAVRLEVTNHRDEPLRLRPVLRPASGPPLELADLIIPARGTSRHDLAPVLLGLVGEPVERSATWGDGSRGGSIWGSATLTVADRGGRFTAWLVSDAPTERLAITSVFKHSAAGAHVLVAPWWRPSKSASVRFVLHNPNDRPVIVEAAAVGGRSGRKVPLFVAPHQSRFVVLDELAGRLGLSASDAAGALRFTERGSHVGVLGQTLVIDDANGFSTSAPISSPAAARDNVLEVPAVMLGRVPAGMPYPAGLEFTAKLVLVNQRPETTSIALTLYAPSGEVFGDVKRVELFPNEVRLVDIVDHWREVAAEGVLGLRVEHEGEPGEVMADLFSVDLTLDNAAHCPLGTHGAIEKIAVTFDLEGAKNTVLMARNTSEHPVSYVAAVTFPTTDGSFETYATMPAALGPHALAMIDLRRLRDDQQVGQDGKVLPRDVSLGSVSLISELPVMMTVDPTIDRENGTTLLCVAQCPDEGTFSPTEPLNQDSVECGSSGVGSGNVSSSTYGKVHEYANVHGCGFNSVGEIICTYKRCQFDAGKPCTPEVTHKYKPFETPMGSLFITWTVKKIFGIGVCFEVSRVKVANNPCPYIRPK